MMSAGVQLQGLAAFRRDLKKVDEQLAKEITGDLLAIGKEIAREAAARVPRKTGKAAGSVRAGLSGGNAYVAGGKASVPYYGWLDFGSRDPVSDGDRRTGPWKGSGAGPQGGRFFNRNVRGRYIYPTIKRNEKEIHKKAIKAFDKAAEKSLEKSY